MPHSYLSDAKLWADNVKVKSIENIKPSFTTSESEKLYIKLIAKL